MNFFWRSSKKKRKKRCHPARLITKSAIDSWSELVRLEGNFWCLQLFMYVWIYFDHQLMMSLDYQQYRPLPITFK